MNIKMPSLTLPWRVSLDNTWGYSVRSIEQFMNVSGKSTDSFVAFKLKHSDAEFIVQAANLHKDMATLLEDLLPILQEHYDPDPTMRKTWPLEFIQRIEEIETRLNRNETVRE